MKGPGLAAREAKEEAKEKVEEEVKVEEEREQPPICAKGTKGEKSGAWQRRPSENRRDGYDHREGYKSKARRYGDR